jgi:hypothetical protein
MIFKKVQATAEKSKTEKWQFREMSGSWIRISQKYKMVNISKGVANTLQPAKKI